jgi:hypothetical protein
MQKLILYIILIIISMTTQSMAGQVSQEDKNKDGKLEIVFDITSRYPETLPQKKNTE